MEQDVWSENQIRKHASAMCPLLDSHLDDIKHTNKARHPGQSTQPEVYTLRIWRFNSQQRLRFLVISDLDGEIAFRKLHGYLNNLELRHLLWGIIANEKNQLAQVTFKNNTNWFTRDSLGPLKRLSGSSGNKVIGHSPTKKLPGKSRSWLIENSSSSSSTCFSGEKHFNTSSIVLTFKRNTLRVACCMALKCGLYFKCGVQTEGSSEKRRPWFKRKQTLSGITQNRMKRVRCRWAISNSPC